MLSTGLLCSRSLVNLKRNRAGLHGNFSEQEIHDVLCHDNCLVSDSLREEAMNLSGCKCLELSTAVEDTLFKSPGDWCRESSGYKLCDVLGVCGQWQCSLNDFHCRRMEYNTLLVPLKGYGNQCSRASSAIIHPGVWIFWIKILYELLW